MTKSESASIKQLETVLENAPTAVFVRTVSDRRLLYANRRAREVFPAESGENGHFPFMEEMEDHIFYVPGSQRCYRVSSCDVDWAGERASIAYLEDVTEGTADEMLLETVNAIPGGIACYQVCGNRFVPIFFSDSVTRLTGHSREEYEEMVKYDVLDIIYEPDRERVLSAVCAAYASGELLDISYRMCHKDGRLIWIHLNGRRMEPLSEQARFYAVFTAISSETRLYQSIAEGTADGIYVIDKSNYELLYTNESGLSFMKDAGDTGMECYRALYGKSKPCDFCVLKNENCCEKEQDIEVTETGCFYRARVQETDWNGISAHVIYLRDITEEVKMRREKERLEMYFQTVVDKLPGGVCVIRLNKDGSMTPEFISKGFADMTRMTVEEATAVYRNDILAGVHPDDAPGIQERLEQVIRKGEDQCVLTGRMLRGDGGYVWVKDHLCVKRMSDGIQRLYCSYTDISRDVEEKARLQSRYEDLIMQHYRTPGPGVLIAGHCNITRSQILKIRDYTDSFLLEEQGKDQQEFFTSISDWIVDEQERRVFLDRYLDMTGLPADGEKSAERIMECFIKPPRRKMGCYARFKVNMVVAPDTGDVTGILTVTDITEQTISDRILNQLSVINHDYIIDLDLERDTYKFLSFNHSATCLPAPKGCYSREIAFREEHLVVPRDQEQYKMALRAENIRRRLRENGSYTFTYSAEGEAGDIYTKNIAVSSIDLRLGRVCLVATDITDSVRKQQSLLNMIAYTFELAGLIHVESGRFTMYTRQIILENLPPYILEDYTKAMAHFVGYYVAGEAAEEQFSIDNMLKRLDERPAGYDFVLPYLSEGGTRYKQINVLWGDQSHGIICLVRADVTDMLAAERQSKKELETALAAAEKANRAKSEFLSSMSHDIRTPMNAIMGMTTLAMSYLEDKERVEDYLRKISISSKHLLSLINDVLDMSKIECSQITLNLLKVSLSQLLKEISAIITSQAGSAGLEFTIRTDGITHDYFYGDSLRINQILLNLLSNAVKFTPEGGKVDFLVEELAQAEGDGRLHYRFTVSDTGIGMPEEFLAHIYSPFARDHSVHGIEGTGLGLSITRGLVDLMQGGISIESRPGQGSVFRVELAFDPAEEAGEPIAGGNGQSRSKEENLAGRRFLVVEDNAINAEILCEILAMCGAEAVLKTDGAQAVEAFQESAPGTYDAILMDIQMPVMNGYEAARAIRAGGREDSETIPIIAMTANAFSEDIRSSMEAGMNAHVAKPIDLSLLYQELNNALSIHTR